MKENNKKLFVAESKEDIPVVNMWTPLDTKVDESYNYIPKSFLFKLFSFLLHIIAIPVLLLYNKIFFGLKIEGRKNLKNVYNSPFISVCNHVHIVDCSMVALALCKFNLYYPTLKQNVDIPGINIIVRLLGGVPIPTKVKALL